MVSVCAGCDAFKPWAGLVSGVIGGCLYVGFSKVCFLKNWCHTKILITRIT